MGAIVLEWLLRRRLERHFGEERLRKLRGFAPPWLRTACSTRAGVGAGQPLAADTSEEAESALADLEAEVEETIRHAYVRVRAEKTP